MCYVWFKYVANVDVTFVLLDIQFDPNGMEIRFCHVSVRYSRHLVPLRGDGVQDSPSWFIQSSVEDLQESVRREAKTVQN